VFCSDGAVPIDNNVSEREMKRALVNRKNSLFVGNPRGGRTAAILASLTSICRRHDVDPQLYLTQLLTNLSQVRKSDLIKWPPDQWKMHPGTNGEFRFSGRSDSPERYRNHSENVRPSMRDHAWPQALAPLCEDSEECPKRRDQDHLLDPLGPVADSEQNGLRQHGERGASRQSQRLLLEIAAKH
jgi:hypothetical protein